MIDEMRTQFFLTDEDEEEADVEIPEDEAVEEPKEAEEEGDLS